MSYKKIIGLFSLLVALFTLLSVRTAYLSASPLLTQTAENQSSYKQVVSSNRAQIYDRNMTGLVNNAEQYRAVILPEPSSIDTILTLTDEYTREELLERMQTGKPFVIDSKLSSVDDPNIRLFQSYNRYRDNGLAAHFIGYLDDAGNGLTGIEKAYNDFLKEHSTETSVKFTLDGMGRYVKGGEISIETGGLSSAGVVLTLDSRIQDIIERVGKQTIERGSIVVLDAKTAEIVGSASFPSYNQNNVAPSVSDEVNTPMINRTLYAYNVGSTFKIATAAAALDAGLSPSITHNCTGSIEVAGQVFQCHYHPGHGVLDMQQALRESCNPYYVALGLQTGAESIRRVASDMGFGKEFPLADGITSAKGYLPTLDELFNPGEVANFSFGQGGLLATPLQVSELVFSVINDGKAVTPSLVKGVTEDGTTLTEQSELPAPIAAMSESTAQTLKEFLTRAVSEQKKNDMKPSLTTAGGKSATAQTGKFDSEGNELYQTWFSGFFPAEEPEYIVTVLVENGTSGNGSAGPVFAEIADLITGLGAS